MRNLFKKKKSKTKPNQIINEFTELADKHEVNGLWVLTNNGDFYHFKDLASRNRFVTLAKVQEEVMQLEIRDLVFKELGNAAPVKHKKDAYTG